MIWNCLGLQEAAWDSLLELTIAGSAATASKKLLTSVGLLFWLCFVVLNWLGLKVWLLSLVHVLPSLPIAGNFVTMMCFAVLKKETDEAVVIDPCTPRGYKWSLEERQHHAVSVSTATHSPVSSIVSQGNFSECRSAAYSLLQKDQGTKCPQPYQYTERVLSHWFSLKAQIGNFFNDWYFFHGNCAMCLTVFFGVLGSRWLHLPKMCNGNCFCSRTTRELLCNWELFLYIWGGPLPCRCCCCHDCHRQVVVNTCFLTAKFLLNTEWNPALKTGEECR